MTGTGFIYALIAGVLPSLVWLFFWTREGDDQPEPRPLLMGCFFAGMIVVFIAIPLEKWAVDLAANNTTVQYIYWAAIEEFLKFCALAVIALHSKSYDEPIDAMIYAIAVALGFAALENTLFIMKTISMSGSLLTSFSTGNMRFIGATLVHVVSSAMIGFSLGWTYYKGFFTRASAWIFGLGLAIAVHATFNIAIAGAGAMDTLKAFGWIWGAVVIIIVLFEEVKAVKPKGVGTPAGTNPTSSPIAPFTPKPTASGPTKLQNA